MKKLIFVTIGLFFMAATISCNSRKGTETSGAETEEQHHDDDTDTNIVTLTEEQIRSIGIEMGRIEQKQLTASLKTNGILKVPNQNKANINSVYRGVVKTLLVQPGNIVSKGQVIATIANPEFVRVQSDYLDVRAKIELAELEVTRQKELNAGNAGALKNLQAAQTSLNTLRTAQSNYEQQIRLMGINPANISNNNLISVLSIKSPIAGVVSAVNAEIGSYIDISTSIAAIVDNSQLHLDLFVYEKDLSKIKNNQIIHFTLTNNPGKEYDAQIYSMGSSFEGDSKAVSVHARVQGDKTGLIDGMNITAAISLEKATVPAIPSAAVITYNGHDYIFILKNDSTGKHDHQNTSTAVTHSNTGQSNENHLVFERIPVAKGTSDVGYTEITLLKEIPKDASVVVKGAFFVLAKQTNVGEHEH